AQVQQAYLQLKPLARPKGTAMERLIHYMVEGLFKRVQGTGYEHFSTPVRKNPKELDEARAWFATSTPYPAFGNMAITGMFLHAVSSASHVHLIDFGELLPFHLPTIMELLASRPGGPPHLRVTGLDTTTFVCPGRKDFKSLRAVAEVGRRLRGTAMRLGLPFEFEYIDIDENQLHLLYQVKRRWSETLVVCAHLELMNFPDDSVVDHGPRDCILRWIHDLKPALFTFVEMDLDSNARPFLSRFQHVLDHHFSVFCSHDALIGAADKRLLSIFEELYFGRAMVNIVSCEGVERVHRPETLDQWRGRMLRLGFAPKQIPGAVTEAMHSMLKRFPLGFGLLLEDGAIRLAWKGTTTVLALGWVLNAPP
ncbi:unnamed protein product, partial [Closterium sp. NIES-53]